MRGYKWESRLGKKWWQSCEETQRKQPQKARKLANLYYNLMDVILSSGDGKSIQTAYVVTRVSDEYEIIAEYKLQVKKQQLIGNTDVMTFDKKAQKNRKEKIKVLYFNVFFPLNHLSNSFKQFDEETE